VWLAVGIVALALFSVLGLAGTSTYWFCTTPCHKVHDDNTLAYDGGSHVMVSCIACHEPVNGNPIEFVMMKLEVLPDVIPTVSNTYEFR
jgi:hypothetical protein